MSSSRLATQVFSSSLRCRAGNVQGTVRSLPWTLARGFQQSAVSRKTVQKLQQKPPANDDETLKAMDTLQALAHKTNMDVWSQPIETLDLIIPSLYSKRPRASILDHWKSFIQTQLNWIRNAQSMFLLAKENAFPGVQVKSRWSPKIFSVRKGAWLEGLRREALASYTAVNEAVAARDTKALRIYTADTYKEALLRRVQAQDKSNHHVWKLHSENAPPEVLSIRSFIGHMGAKDPLQGNRLVTQALIKFDTNQSLQIYNSRGKLIGGSDQPKRVVEHLVFQKRGWTPSPWIIRDQLYETLDTKLTRLQ